MSPRGVHALKQTAFRLAPALLAKLKTTADHRGETMTDIVARAVTAELDRLEGNPDDSQ